jgi:hypothetical protein
MRPEAEASGYPIRADETKCRSRSLRDDNQKGNGNGNGNGNGKGNS